MKSKMNPAYRLEILQMPAQKKQVTKKPWKPDKTQVSTLSEIRTLCEELKTLRKKKEKRRKMFLRNEVKSKFNALLEREKQLALNHVKKYKKLTPRRLNSILGLSEGYLERVLEEKQLDVERSERMKQVWSNKTQKQRKRVLEKLQEHNEKKQKNVWRPERKHVAPLTKIITIYEELRTLPGNGEKEKRRMLYKEIQAEVKKIEDSSNNSFTHGRLADVLRVPRNSLKTIIHERKPYVKKTRTERRDKPWLPSETQTSLLGEMLTIQHAIKELGYKKDKPRREKLKHEMRRLHLKLNLKEEKLQKKYNRGYKLPTPSRLYNLLGIPPQHFKSQSS